MQPLPDLAQMMQLAQSPAGQQLIAMLRKNGGNELQEAVSKASAGDFEQAKTILSSLLSDQESQELLRKLGENT